MSCLIGIRRIVAATGFEPISMGESSDEVAYSQSPDVVTSL